MPGTLSQRIDFEFARALEWREGALRLHAADPELARYPGGDSPASAAVARASSLFSRAGACPGARTSTILTALALALLLLAGLAGAQAARLALSSGNGEPVNIIWFFGTALGLQTVFLILTLALLPGTLARSRTLRELGRGAAALGSSALACAVRLSSPGRENGHVELGEVLARLRSLRSLVPRAMALSHAAWVSFNLVFLLICALILSAEHHAFGWQSTFLEDGAEAEAVLTLLTAPARPFMGAPTPEQVRVSRFDAQQGDWAHQLDEASQALALRQSWSLRLLASVAGWGLTPRLALLAACLVAARRARRKLMPSETDPYVLALQETAAPPLATSTTAAVLPAPAEPTSLVGGAGTAREPESWLACSWLRAVESEDLVRALWGSARAGWTAMPALVSRETEAAAERTLRQHAEEGAAVGLLLCCDLAATPDASLRRLLTSLTEGMGDAGRLVIVLTGGEAFRSSRLGRAGEGITGRRRAWVNTLAGWGIREGSVVDFDVSHATSPARSALAKSLGVPYDTGAVGGLHAALAEIEVLAPTWLERLEAVTADARESLSLRLAAEARARLNAHFDAEAPGTPAAGAASLALSALLRRSLALPESLDADAISTAAAGVGRMAKLLGQLGSVKPRFVVAGLGVGLLAGPLGGALAAGSAGLIAGTSLMGTLGPLGAALGGALSLPGQDNPGRDDADTRPSEDLLGFPARSAVLHAVLLAAQGQGEELVAERLKEMESHAAMRSDIGTVAQVLALTEAARSCEARP